MALTRITKGVIKPNENYQAGIVTATGLDVNGNGDISGNLSVGGILTYEDVTSIDSVGIITAQKDIHVGAGISAVGIGTFGGLDINGDLDVDGHTNLDNVSIAGVSTFSDGKAKFDELGNLSTRYIDLSQGEGTKYIDANLGVGNQLSLRGYVGSSYHHLADFVRSGLVGLNYSGNRKLETSNTGVSVTGTVVATGADINGDLDVDGHTNLDNVSIAGITTTTENIRIQGDNKYLTIGAGNDIGLVHTGGESFITNATGHLTRRCDVHKWENFAGSAEYLRIDSSGNLIVNNTTAAAGSYTYKLLVSDNISSTEQTFGIQYPGVVTYGLNAESNSDFTIKKDGAERLRILSGGNIGIGTNLAPHKLSVKGTISKISGTSGIQIVNISNDGSQNGTIAINQASGVERIKLHSNGVSYFNGGNVGIGSLVPTGKFDIAPGGNSFIKFGQDADNPKIEIFRSTGQASNTHYSVELQQILGDFIFSTAAAANLGSHSYSEKLRIKSTGSVGIGSDNPHRKLVVGNNADMAVIGSNAGIYLGTHPTGGFQNNSAIARAAANNFHITGSIAGDLCIASESSAAMIFGLSHSAGAIDQAVHINRLREFNIYYGAQSIKIHTGNHSSSVERLRINSSGRVGINTTTDSMDGVTGNLNIANTNFNNHTVINLSRNTTSDRAQIRFQNPNGNIGSIDTFGSDLIISSGNDLKFRTKPSGGSMTERLCITSDGDTELRNTVSGINNSYSQYLKFRTTQTNGQSAVTGQIAGQGKSGWGGDLVFSTKPANSSPNDTLTEKLRITSDGKVGINQSPTRELSLHSPDNNNALIHFTNDDTGETASDGILIGLNGNEDCIVNNQESGKNIIFYTHNGSSVGERLRITSNGDIYTTGDQVRDGARLTIEKNVAGISTAIHLHNANGSGTASKISCSKAIIISADVENNSPTNKSYISLHTDNSERLRIKYDSSLLHTRTDNVGRYDVEFRNTGGITDGNYGGIKFTQGSTGGTGLAAMEIAYANTGRPDIVFKHRDHGGGNSLSEAMRIDSNGYVTKPNNAMFKVQRTSNQGVTSNGWHTIQFNNDSSNGMFDVGNNFSTSNHRFTAPVNGYYHFGLNQRIDGGSGDYFRVAFSVNGDVGASDNYPHGHAIYDDNDGFSYYSFSISTLIYLTAGQYVMAEAFSNSDTSWTIQDESIFFGYLVG